MTRSPLKLNLKKDRMHRDLGKAPGTSIIQANIAKEMSKGGVFTKRAQFAENAKKWKHPGMKNYLTLLFNKETLQ